jgi:hypothetical protein
MRVFIMPARLTQAPPQKHHGRQKAGKPLQRGSFPSKRRVNVRNFTGGGEDEIPVVRLEVDHERHPTDGDQFAEWRTRVAPDENKVITLIRDAKGQSGKLPAEIARFAGNRILKSFTAQRGYTAQ